MIGTTKTIVITFIRSFLKEIRTEYNDVILDDYSSMKISDLQVIQD